MNPRVLSGIFTPKASAAFTAFAPSSTRPGLRSFSKNAFNSDFSRASCSLRSASSRAARASASARSSASFRALYAAETPNHLSSSPHIAAPMQPGNFCGYSFASCHACFRAFRIAETYAPCRAGSLPYSFSSGLYLALNASLSSGVLQLVQALQNAPTSPPNCSMVKECRPVCFSSVYSVNPIGARYSPASTNKQYKSVSAAGYSFSGLPTCRHSRTDPLTVGSSFTNAK